MTRTLVCFHAHPDDEAMLTAGTMAKAAAGGDRVVLVVATRGERGDADGRWPRPSTTSARCGSQELDRSAAALGVARVEVLGYGDSGSDGVPAARARSSTRRSTRRRRGWRRSCARRRPTS